MEAKEDNSVRAGGGGGRGEKKTTMGTKTSNSFSNSGLSQRGKHVYYQLFRMSWKKSRCTVLWEKIKIYLCTVGIKRQAAIKGKKKRN
jgi:hypothetical protein